MKNNRIASGAMLTALALIFSYVEALIPIPLGIPGIKLGLANILVLFALYLLDFRYAFCINLLRIILSGLLFGSVFSLVYSLCGGMLSLLIMFLLKKTNLFSVIGISMAGGVFHNLGQIVVALFVVNTPQILLYFPVLLFAGIITGVLNGFVAALIIQRLSSMKL